MPQRQTEPPPADASIAFWVKCPDCGHCWPAAYFPMEMSKFAKIAMKAVCPKGCLGRPVIAEQSEGVLREPTP